MSRVLLRLYALATVAKLKRRTACFHNCSLISMGFAELCKLPLYFLNYPLTSLSGLRCKRPRSVAKRAPQFSAFSPDNSLTHLNGL